jgi:hypothetical protein
MSLSFVSRLLDAPSSRRAQRAAKRAWRKLFFWPVYAARKSRFAALGQEPGEPLHCADIDLDGACRCKARHNFIPLTLGNISAFARARPGDASAQRLVPTASAIDLEPFRDFTAWRIGVSRATNGKYHRSANRARRLGYVTRCVGLNAYRRSVRELTGSKLRRSKGLVVLDALWLPAKDLEDTLAPPRPPSCPRHWRQCWGCFRTTEEGEKLMGFAVLVRAGNLVWVQRFIGHGDALVDGVMKLMMFDIMQWILARDEAATQGIRYFLHGYVEEGGQGLFDWKRYLGFKPMLLRVLPNVNGAP